MMKKIALLAAALTLTMPAFAEAPAAPSAAAPAATADAKPAKKHGRAKHHKKAEKKDDAAK
jgi:hypothetical protein